jgi:hypothetical protein
MLTQHDRARAAAHTERFSEYTQHRPAETALYQLVAQHLETFLAEARERHERGLPAYVEKEFRALLKCGIHAFGFLRALCKLCGQELATFHPLTAPDSTDLQDIASDVAIRTLAWLRRGGLLHDERDETDAPEQPDRSALVACLEGSLGLGELTALRERNQAEGDGDDARPAPSKSAQRGGTDRGFDLHAGVV